MSRRDEQEDMRGGGEKKMRGRGGSIRVTNNVVYFTSKFLRQGNSALAKNFVETITQVLQSTKVQFCSHAKNLRLIYILVPT